ncbi:DDE-type integrase/transposase/recombinase [Amycolatopsis sp. RM579]|uniref:DDE-type integrase/transposase/recombinase n=1 Tax=Amycolatopsis pithecellobii TaxID=664692 RepID=A0A6N7Z4W1_9PSEU|nr:DDE-type integrase/transposase/recombinase [Amycolatopsis pithecellobii]
MLLVRCGINRLAATDRVTSEPVRRYEYDHPGSLIHVDIIKFGNIPGGGWRYVGKQPGYRNRSATAARTGEPRSKWRNPIVGRAYVHTVVDDHSRIAYAEICGDEKTETAVSDPRRGRRRAG